MTDEREALTPALEATYQAGLAAHLQVVKRNEELEISLKEIRAFYDTRSAECDQLNITITDLKSDAKDLKSRAEMLITVNARLSAIIDNAAAVLSGVPTIRGKPPAGNDPMKELEKMIKNGNGETLTTDRR